MILRVFVALECGLFKEAWKLRLFQHTALIDWIYKPSIN